MNRKRSTWLLAAILAGVLFAGCGSSSSSSSQSTATPAATTSSSPSSSSSSQSSAVAAGVQACKNGVQHAPTLSSSTKAKLEGICDKAANGDVESARKAAQEVCTEVVNASPLPAGSAKESALAACKSK